MRTHGQTVSGLRLCSVLLRLLPPGVLLKELRNIKKTIVRILKMSGPIDRYLNIELYSKCDFIFAV